MAFPTDAAALAHLHHQMAVDAPSTPSPTSNPSPQKVQNIYNCPDITSASSVSAFVNNELYERNLLPQIIAYDPTGLHLSLAEKGHQVQSDSKSAQTTEIMPLSLPSSEAQAKLHILAPTMSRLANGTDMDYREVNNWIYLCDTTAVDRAVEQLSTENFFLILSKVSDYENIAKALRSSYRGSQLEPQEFGQKIWWAVTTRQYAVVKLLLAWNPDKISKDDLGWAIRHAAADRENIEILRELCAQKTDISTYDMTTALHTGIQNQRLDVIEALLSRSIDIHSDCINTALEKAVACKNVPIINALMNYNSLHNRLNARGLEWAAGCGDLDMIHVLIARNAEHCLYSVFTAVETALILGHLDIFRVLVNQFYSDEFPENISRQMLPRAAQHGWDAIVNDWIASKNFVDLPIDNLELAIQKACSSKHLDIVKILIGCSRFPETSSQSFVDALKLAVTSHSVDIVKVLIACGRCREIPVNNIETMIRGTSNSEIKELLQAVLR